MTSLSSSLTAHQLFFCAMFVILFSLLLVSCQQVTRARLFQFYVREGRAAKARSIYGDLLAPPKVSPLTHIFFAIVP